MQYGILVNKVCKTILQKHTDVQGFPDFLMLSGVRCSENPLRELIFSTLLVS